MSLLWSATNASLASPSLVDAPIKTHWINFVAFVFNVHPNERFQSRTFALASWSPPLAPLSERHARTHARGHTRTHSLLLTRTLKKMVNHSYFALIYIPTVPLKLSPHNIQHLLHQSADVIQFIIRVIEALDCWIMNELCSEGIT